MLKTNQSTTDVDLALALENEEGTFLAQKSGQAFLVVAEKGHSIASMRAMPPAASDPWYITKIGNSTEIAPEGSGSKDRGGREHNRTVRE